MVDRDQEFDEFAHGAWPRLHRSAYLLTGDRQLAEDLAQTALERTYATWRTVRRGDALAYARRIIVNLNVDRLRRRRMTEVGGDALSHGELELACVSFQGGDCAPAVVRLEDGETTFEWGFGTDRFLEPRTAMEVFSGAASAAAAPSLAVAGLPDDSVTRAEFINTAGEVVAGTVDHTMAPGSSILWAEVPGALARVVAYDTDGQVVDDHTLRVCSGGVDCEVR